MVEFARKRTITPNSRSKVEAWYSSVAAFERFLGSTALLAIGDGSWATKYPVVEDFERKNRYHVMVNSTLVITVRLYPEYLGYFSVDRIGPI